MNIGLKKDRIDEMTILDYVVLDFHPKKKNQMYIKHKQNILNNIFLK